MRRAISLLVLVSALAGCRGASATAAQTPVQTLGPTAAGLPTQAPGPTAPQPPFTQAQSDLCKEQSHSIVGAAESVGGLIGDKPAMSREDLLKWVTPTLAAMTAVQTSGQDLLEPRLSQAIAKLKTLVEQLSQPITADALQQANDLFYYTVVDVDYQIWPDVHPNPNCGMIDSWVSANVKK